MNINEMKTETISKLNALLDAVKSDSLDAGNLQNLHSLLHGRPIEASNLQDQSCDPDFWDKQTYLQYQPAAAKGAAR